MVNEFLQTVALSSSVGAMVGGLFTLVQRLIHEGREDKRVRSRVLVEKKVDALVELHSKLVECYKTLSQYESTALNSKVDPERYDDEVVTAYESFVYTLDSAEIYLTDNQREKLRQAEDKFSYVLRFIERKTTPEQYDDDALEPSNFYDFEEFDEARDDAKRSLEPRIRRCVIRLKIQPTIQRSLPRLDLSTKISLGIHRYETISQFVDIMSLPFSSNPQMIDLLEKSPICRKRAYVQNQGVQI